MYADAISRINSGNTIQITTKYQENVSLRALQKVWDPLQNSENNSSVKHQITISRISGMFPVTKEDIHQANDNTKFISKFDQLDFVQILPEGVCDKIFLLLPTEDVLACCIVSSSWRNVINNDLHWMDRCSRHGFKPEDENPMKWKNTASHVKVGVELIHRTSPEWSISQITSLRIKPCCEWGMYLRQCLHNRWNWRNGNYVVLTLQPPEVPNRNEICTAADCNGKYLAMGTRIGLVYVWNVTGIPEHMHTYSPIRQNTVVEEIQLNAEYLAVLYQYGLLRVYLLPELADSKKDDPLELVIENRIWGLAVNMQEFTLFTQEMRDGAIQESETPVSLQPQEQEYNNNDIEGWLQELFRNDPWFETEYESSQMTFVLTDNLLIVTGYSCNCFLVWNLSMKKFVKKEQYPEGVRAGREAFGNNSIVYLAAKRRVPQQRTSVLTIFVYDLLKSFQHTEIRAEHLTEDLRINPLDNDQLVWRSTNSDITAMQVSTQEYIFTRSADCVNNLVAHGPFIIYHQMNGSIVALNWHGEVLYEAMSHTGKLEVMICHKDYLVTGGNMKKLNVWDIQAGKMLYTLQYESTEINRHFVDDTKILTISHNRPAQMIGYW